MDAKTITERRRLQGVVRNLNYAAQFAETLERDGGLAYADLLFCIRLQVAKAQQFLDEIPLSGPYVKKRDRRGAHELLL